MPLAQIVEKSAWVATQFVPMGSLLPSIPAVVVSDQGARRAAHGNPLRVADMVPAAGLPLPNAGRVRVLDERGRLLAVADRRGDGTLRPKIVLV